MSPRPIHEGRNVKRIREILGIKQDALDKACIVYKECMKKI